MPEFIAVLDFGSQYTQLIARRVRENHVYCEILPHTTTAAELRSKSVKGIVLSGGPSGVYEREAPRCDPELLDMGLPVLGICYGMQLACEHYGASVVPSSQREYGKTSLEIVDQNSLFKGVDGSTTVWMSHGDRVESADSNLRVLARTESCPFAAVWHPKTKFYGLQFHPEVTHTSAGSTILANFLTAICGCSGDWSLSGFVEEQISELRERIGSDGVVCGLSGGVDSSVVALLLHRAVGDQLHCIFVDNGVLRRGEREQVDTTFRKIFGDSFHLVDAEDRFLERLREVKDPEEKRKRIGGEFIDVFTDATKSLSRIKYLAQGTLYPDVIESYSPIGGPSATIKSHHNVGGLPENLEFELVEPLRFLFKDEVRELGRELGLPDELVQRQPFPGPGLAVRIVGEVTRDRLEILRGADAIVQEELGPLEFYRDIWQSFAVLLPIQTVGVMGDKRTYEFVIALRIVDSVDGMTANWYPLPDAVLTKISNRISNEVHGVNRVVLDISSKPPSTIEWE